MITNIIISVVLITTIIATITDLKKHEVPDFVSYFLIIFGIGTNIIISLLSNSIYPILFSVIGAVALYAFGAALYYTGMWGGGDAKLITGYGANFATFPALIAWPFLLTMIFNILFFGAVIGILWGVYLAIKHKKKFAEEIRKLLHKYKKIVVLLYVTLILIIVLFAFIRNIFIPFIWGAGVILFYLLLSLKAIEESCMYRLIKPKNLTEGDWISEDVKIKDKVVYKPERTGISLSEIIKLQELEKQNKLNNVVVKEGLPYVPAFLVALIATLLNIDILFYIFNALL
ncbi:prepilin peptidase [Candidatus Woesearchaeota archaeon]|jgi:Flp pilus assembly protein protease CpaA|nr:prepilin peptidase [Candidatus Woesearchaeota archaeon]MBT7403081.1 prepilin peptidase [Candidatus Woesearchaeota archaeon]